VQLEAEVRLSASLEATVKECVLSVSDVDPRLAVKADRDLLSSAVENLLQNAFKFTRPKSEVTLTAYAGADRIFIEVQDHCGGLPRATRKKCFGRSRSRVRIRRASDLDCQSLGAALR
jgi:signal transduction histidine kinase